MNEWTDQEIRTLLNNPSNGDVARLLNRSVKSVECKRRKVRRSGLKQKAARVRGESLDADKAVHDENYWHDQYQSLFQRYNRAVKEAVAVDRLVKEVKDLAPTSYTAAPAITQRRRDKSSSPQSAVLLLSDTHVGKVVRPDQTLNFGGYNFEMFLARLKYVEESTLSILRDHTNTEVPELVVAMLGDMLDGALLHGVEGGLRNTCFSQFYGAGHALAQFLRNLARHVPSVRIETVVGNHCVDEKTEILTRRGWKAVGELAGDDQCLGLSEDGKACFWQPIDEIVREKAVDRLVSVQNRQFDFCGTEHHRFYYWVPGHPVLNQARWSELPHSDDRFSIHVPTAAKIDLPGRPDLRPFLALAGAVLSDGHISRLHSRVTVYQTKNTDWIEQALRSSGLVFSRCERVRKLPESIGGVKLRKQGYTREVAFNLSAKSARDFLGITGLEKHKIPSWAWELSRDEFMVFFEALMRGDGTGLGSNSPTLSAKSAKFASDLQGLLATHGMTSNVAQYQPAASKNPQYRLNITYTDRQSVGASARVEYSAPEGDVWCVRTRSENFFCRRNGKSYFTGNTRWQNQHKMPTENRFSNFDFFLYAYVQALTQDISNIKWSLNQQPFQIFGVQGFTFYAAHGDHWRGGDRALGIPNHAVGRAVSSTVQLFGKHGQQAPHYYLAGHLHRSITLPHAIGEVIINGGFPGLDNFGLAGGFNPVDPSQRLFLVHPKFGKTASYDLMMKFASVENEPPYRIPAGFPVE